MATTTTEATAPHNAFSPRPAATRSQAIVGGFCMLILAGALLASATVTLACAGLSSCHSGALTEQTEASLPLGDARG